MSTGSRLDYPTETDHLMEPSGNQGKTQIMEPDSKGNAGYALVSYTKPTTTRAGAVGLHQLPIKRTLW